MDDLVMGEALPSGGRSCPNCGSPVGAKFCGDCGQRRGDVVVPFRHFVHELFDTVFNLDSRLVTTVVSLVRRPGRVPAEYLAGRRARFTHPIRLFLATTTLSLLLLTPFASNFRFAAGMFASFDAAESPPAAGEPTRLDDTSGRLTAAERAHSRRLFATMNSLVSLSAPLLALYMQVIFWRRRTYFVEHMVAALYIMSFGLMLLPPLALVGWLSGLIDTVGIDFVFMAGLVVVFPYFVLTARRLYDVSLLSAVLRCGAVTFAFLLTVIVEYMVFNTVMLMS